MDFVIRESIAEPGEFVLVSPDVATCDDCWRDCLDPADRRYAYPFTNCTNCGPRYTIIADIPYDRPQTTMAPFRMCAECQAEYDDPGNRRFHAQPNACSRCGPTIALWRGTVRSSPNSRRMSSATFVCRSCAIYAKFCEPETSSRSRVWCVRAHPSSRSVEPRLPQRRNFSEYVLARTRGAGFARGRVRCPPPCDGAAQRRRHFPWASRHSERTLAMRSVTDVSGNSRQGP